jgi:hypothetical protein
MSIGMQSYIILQFNYDDHPEYIQQIKKGCDVDDWIAKLPTPTYVH